MRKRMMMGITMITVIWALVIETKQKEKLSSAHWNDREG